MPKIISLTFAAVLTVVAASFWFKSSVPQTAASDRVQTTSVDDLQRKANVKSMPIQIVDDRSLEFTNPVIDPAQ